MCFLPDAAKRLLRKKHQDQRIQPNIAEPLQPVDIIVTKIGRLNERDIRDIEACIKKGNVSEAQIRERALLVVQTYVGPEEDYLYHLELVLKKFLKNNVNR